MQRIQRFLDYEQSLFFSKSVEQNARDSKTTTRMPEGARFSRLAASPLDARPRALLSLNLKEN